MQTQPHFAISQQIGGDDLERDKKILKITGEKSSKSEIKMRQFYRHFLHDSKAIDVVMATRRRYILYYPQDYHHIFLNDKK